jgi:hypothetical protein
LPIRMTLLTDAMFVSLKFLEMNVAIMLVSGPVPQWVP